MLKLLILTILAAGTGYKPAEKKASAEVCSELSKLIGCKAENGTKQYGQNRNVLKRVINHSQEGQSRPDLVTFKQTVGLIYTGWYAEAVESVCVNLTVRSYETHKHRKVAVSGRSHIIPVLYGIARIHHFTDKRRYILRLPLMSVGFIRFRIVGALHIGSIDKMYLCFGFG